MAATLALPASYRTQIAEALATVDRPVLIWRQFQDCAGNSESILRSPHPDVAEIVLETLAWNYHELIMAGSGAQAEAMSTQAVRDLKGKYIAVIEGAIPTGDGLLHDRGPLGARHRAGGRGQRQGDDRGRRVRLGRRAGAARPDRGSGGPGRRSGRERGQPRRLPAQPGEHGRGAGALPDLRRDARARPVQPAAVRLRRSDPRPVRAAGVLRRRLVRRGVGRRGAPQGLLPVQDGVQGSVGDLQLPERALERRHELADRGGPQLHRLRLARVLGHR